MNDGTPRRDESDALRDRVRKAIGTLFEIEEEIGRGGMAVVYRARDVRLRRRVALKVLPPELAFREEVKRRFLREAQMAAQLSHPNIVPIYAVDEIDGIVFFAMGLVEGDPLARLLVHDPRPPLAVVRKLLGEVAGALSYAHAHGVVHRDVKPDNILVESATGRALVSDFGIARAAEGDARLTATGNAVGTPAYMSPEQAMGERDIDGRSDIYSLGIVGYQMLAGDLPFQAANTPAMLMKHISAQPIPLNEARSDLPGNIVFAIECAMAKGRDERWPDASAFAAAVAADAPAPFASGDRQPDPPTPDAARDHLPNAPPGASIGVSRNRKLPGLHIEPVMANSPGRRADAPSRSAAERDRPLAAPRFPALPPNGMFRPETREDGKEALREWREQQLLWRERNRSRPPDPSTMSRKQIRRAQREGLLGPTSPEERIRRVQRSAVSWVLVSSFLFTINVLTSRGFPWFVFPSFAMGIGVASRIASLWVDGIRVGRLFRPQPRVERERISSPDEARSAYGARSLHEPGTAANPLVRVAAADLADIPREVLDGPHGATIREAAHAKAIIADVLAKLPPADRQMLPEIQPTVDALVERVRSLAQGLHQLDQDTSGDAREKLDRRIADTKALGAGAPDAERRLQLLERQLATIKDLSSRRETVAQQLENALLVLQTMKLDLMKLRSSGLDAKLDASTGATQEARALSTDIGRVIEAANEVRKM